MTCVIGLSAGGKVYIGGDSAAASGWTRRVSGLPKVFRLGEFLIGYTDSFRMGQILQYHLSIRPQEENESDSEYMVNGFVEAVRACLKEYGFSKVDNNQEEGGAFLVGYRGKLYDFTSDFHVNCYSDDLAAVGCGAEYALGALKVLERDKQQPPEERIYIALGIAAYFSMGVCAPFMVLEI
jgi:ATP-dependent protease HslVU (ClpYQ) peptidase subunit